MGYGARFNEQVRQGEGRNDGRLRAWIGDIPNITIVRAAGGRRAECTVCFAVRAFLAVVCGCTRRNLFRRRVALDHAAGRGALEGDDQPAEHVPHEGEAAL